MALPLSGRTIVVTRPKGLSELLCTAIIAQGAQPWLFPVIDIAPLNDLTSLHHLASLLADYHLAFFVSANAVEHAFKLFDKDAWPGHLQVAAVGPSTASALHRKGFANVITPSERFDSEAVLALAAFQADAVRNKRVLVLRGDGGRDLLAATLRERGASVDFVTCYQRRRARTDPAQLISQHMHGKLDALIFTSSEGARYFAEIVGDASSKMLTELPCFTPHARITEQLHLLGAQQVVTTAPGDEGIVAALVRHFR